MLLLRLYPGGGEGAGLVEPIQFFYASLLVVAEGVAVLVQRDGWAGVAQQPGERYDVHPLLHAPGGEGVPEAVEVGVGDPRPPHTPLEQILIGAPLIRGRFIVLPVFPPRKSPSAAGPAKRRKYEMELEVNLNSDLAHVVFRASL